MNTTKTAILKSLAPSKKKSSKYRVWYVPIFIVTCLKKPGKESLVLDAAAAVQGEFSNANLVAILIKFREKVFPIDQIRMQTIKTYSVVYRRDNATQSIQTS